MKSLLNAFYENSISRKSALEQAFFTNQDFVVQLLSLYKILQPQFEPPAVAQLFLQAVGELVDEPPRQDNLINLITYQWVIAYIYDHFETIKQRSDFNLIQITLLSANIKQLNNLLRSLIGERPEKLKRLLSQIEQNFHSYQLHLLFNEADWK